MYHAVDGNFTQSMKDKGTDVDNLPLTLGASYFADEEDAATYFRTVPPTKSEVSCAYFVT